MKKRILSTVLTLALLISVAAIGAVPAAATVIAPKADLVFVVDTTGSMAGAMANLRNNIGAFVSELEASEMGIVIRLGLIEYKDVSPVSEGGDGPSGKTVVHEYNGSTWMDVDGFRAVLGSLIAIGGNDEPETAIDALGFLVNDNGIDPPIIWADGAYRFAFLLTDASNKVYNQWGYTSMSEIANDLAEQNICTSVIGPALADYVLLTEATGGTLASLNSNFSGALGALVDNIVEVIFTWTVEFVDWDGTSIDVQEIKDGLAAVEPAEPTRDGWVFAGWDVPFDNVTGDLTVTAQYDPTISGLAAMACVEKLSGNKNNLTITVSEQWTDGSVVPVTETFAIDNNAAATYSVGPYKVYVDTKGNTQIRECYIVE